MKKISTIILAAGQSTRFNSEKSKIFHEIAGKPIIDYLFSVAKKISNDVVIVCNDKNIKYFKKHFNKCKIALQRNPRGTAHAVLTAKKYISWLSIKSKSNK